MPSPAKATQPRSSVAVAARRLLLPVYLPWIMMTLGAAMLAPTLPSYLSGSGYSDSQVGVVMAAAGVGAALSALPTGGLIAKVGTKSVIVLWLVIMAIAVAALGLTTALVALVGLRLASGAAATAIRLGGQTEITGRVTVRLRGR